MGQVQGAAAPQVQGDRRLAANVRLCRQAQGRAVDAKCASILQSGAPFPGANVDLRTVYAVLSGVVAFFQLPLVVLAAIGAAAIALGVWLCSACCCRRADATGNKGTKQA